MNIKHETNKKDTIKNAIAFFVWYHLYMYMSLEFLNVQRIIRLPTSYMATGVYPRE